ncbi:MAG: hypothetical protein VKK62_04415 [Synechococcaceae cyanobacterium]|nr:hypothetical protein [Synechococcaceae cyanobacterium]
MSAADQFTLVLESAGSTATELAAFRRERHRYPSLVELWRQPSQDAIWKPAHTMQDQRELGMLRAQEQQEIRWFPRNFA